MLVFAAWTLVVREVLNRLGGKCRLCERIRFHARRLYTVRCFQAA